MYAHLMRIIAQLCSLCVYTSKSSVSPDLQNIIDKHSKVFEVIPKSILPPRDHDNAIQLMLGSVYPNNRPYRYPYG